MKRLGVRHGPRLNWHLRRLALAHAASTIGYWSTTIAVLVYAYEQGGTALVGVAAFIRLMPAALASPVAGVLADRHPRERVLVVAGLLRAIVLGSVAVSVAVGAPVALALTLVGVNAALWASFRPAMRALMPDLARAPDELVRANVVASMVESVGMLAGPAAGGALLAATSPAVVFAVAAGLLGTSAVLVAGVRPPVDLRRAPRTAGGSMRAQMAEGMRALTGDGSMRLVLRLTIGQTLSYGALSVLIVALAAGVLHEDPGWVGYLNGALGLGGVVGGLALSRLIPGRLTSCAAAGAALWGLPLCVLGLWPSLPAALACIVCVGIANTLLDVSLNTLLQRVTDPDVVARTFAMLGLVGIAALAVGGLATPLVVSLLGVRGALVAVGLLLPLLALYGGMEERQRASFGSGPAAPRMSFVVGSSA